MTAKKKTQDQVILDLINQVREKKESIRAVENPCWKTNCSYVVNGERVNIRVLRNTKEVINIASSVCMFETAHIQACEKLGVQEPLTISGYTPEQWFNDLKLQLDKLNIEKEKSKLAALEDRLNKIVTPELRREMELEEIQKELSLDK